MEKLVFGVIATVLLAFNGNAQKVGELKDDKFEITEDLSFLKEQWNKMLQENKIEGVIDRFEITLENYKDEKDSAYYQITGYSKDNFVKVATELIFSRGIFSLDPIASTCTCNGCTVGCHPAKLRKIARYCDNPCPECSKSDTAH